MFFLLYDLSNLLFLYSYWLSIFLTFSVFKWIKSALRVLKSSPRLIFLFLNHLYFCSFCFSIFYSYWLSIFLALCVFLESNLLLFCSSCVSIFKMFISLPVPGFKSSCLILFLLFNVAKFFSYLLFLLFNASKFFSPLYFLL